VHVFSTVAESNHEKRASREHRKTWTQKSSKLKGLQNGFGELAVVDLVDYLLYEKRSRQASMIDSNVSRCTTFFNVLRGYYTPDEGLFSTRVTLLPNIWSTKKTGRRPVVVISI
jgi:ABC-type branched-subunit amino acid transport system ATPase component